MPGYTYHYAPLEQIRGTGTDPRSDLYALAVTIYRLVTGSLPPDALMRATATLQGEQDPLRPANELNDRVPEAVAAVLTRALSQLPAERPATAAAMRLALQLASPARLLPDHRPATLAHSINGSRMQIDSPLEEPEHEAREIDGDPTTAVSELTNAGQVVLPPPAIGPDDQTAAGHSFRFGSGVAWRAGVVLGLLLLATVVLGYRRFTRQSGQSGLGAAIMRREASAPAPAAFKEVMRYHLQVISDTGGKKRVAGTELALDGRLLKFHFTSSRPGYLYLVGPGEQAARTAFLTAQPNPAWGVKSNLLAAATDYRFPSLGDTWIEVAAGATRRTYLVLFAPEPLAQPDFLAGAARHDLTPAEESDLAELQKRFGQEVRIETRNDQSIVTVPAERASGAPLLFEINLRRKTDQERGNKQ
jgi:hypothetical protein